MPTGRVLDHRVAKRMLRSTHGASPTHRRAPLDRYTAVEFAAALGREAEMTADVTTGFQVLKHPAPRFGSPTRTRALVSGVSARLDSALHDPSDNCLGGGWSRNRCRNRILLGQLRHRPVPGEAHPPAAIQRRRVVARHPRYPAPCRRAHTEVDHRDADRACRSSSTQRRGLRIDPTRELCRGHPAAPESCHGPLGSGAGRPLRGIRQLQPGIRPAEKPALRRSPRPLGDRKPFRGQPGG
jgi:hypothetical protein